MKMISISKLFVNFLFLLTFPVLAGNLSFLSIIIAFGVLLLFWAFGRKMLQFSNILNNADGTLYEGVAIFLGGLLTFPMLTICHYLGVNNLWIIIPGLISLLFILRDCLTQKIVVILADKIQTSFIAVLLIIAISLFYGENLFEYTSPTPLLRTIDYSDNLFFTSVVVSMKTGVVSNAFYEIGTPINYHVGSFMWPAVFSSITGISAHISQWGIWIPFLRFLFLFLLGELSVLVLSKQFRFAPSQYKYLGPLSILLFILLSAINPQYLIKLNLEKILWIGTPFTLPDLPAIGGGFIISLLLLYLIFAEEVEKTIQSKLIFAFLLGILIIFKVTIYFALYPIIFLYSCWIFLKEKRKLIYPVLASLPISLIGYMLFFMSGSTTKNVLKPGWMSEDFLGLMHLQGHSLLIGFAASIATILIIWSNWNLISIMLINYYSKEKNSTFLILANCSILGLLSTILLANTFRIEDYDEFNHYLGEQSMNLMQFVKSSLVFVHIFGIIGVIGLYQLFKQRIAKRIFSLVIGVWCLFILLSIVTRQSKFTRANLISNEKWANEVVHEVESVAKENTSLFAMNSNVNHSSFYITAHEKGRWWTAMSYGLDGGQRPKINMYRYRAVKNFIENNMVDVQRALLIKNNVKYLVAIPENVGKLKNLCNLGYVVKVPNCNWVYEIR